MYGVDQNLVTRVLQCRALVAAIGVTLLLASCAPSAWAQAAKKKPAPAPAKKAAAPTANKKAAAANASKFKVKPVPAGFETIAQWQAARGKAQQALQMEALDDEGRKAITDFWTNVFSVQMTQPAGLPFLHNPSPRNPISRENVRKDLAQAKPAVLPFVNEIAFRTMSEVAAGDYHPVGRVNAMLVIGELDQQPRGQAEGKPTPAVPFAPALTQSGGLLATLENTKLPTAVRIAALVGIQRHAEAVGLPAAGQTAIRAALTKLLKEPPADPADADGNAWLRMRAANVLATIKGGAGPEATKEIAALVNDSKAGAVARCGAASAVGQIALDASIDAAQLAGGLGNLTIEVCQQELQRAGAEGEPIASQKLEQQVGCAVRAFGGGLKSVKDAAAKAVVDDVAAKVGEVHALFAGGAAVEAAGVNEKLAELRKSLQTHKLMAASAETAKPADASAETAASATATKKAAAKQPAATTK